MCTPGFLYRILAGISYINIVTQWRIVGTDIIRIARYLIINQEFEIFQLTGYKDMVPLVLLLQCIVYGTVCGFVIRLMLCVIAELENAGISGFDSNRVCTVLLFEDYAVTAFSV